MFEIVRKKMISVHRSRHVAHFWGNLGSVEIEIGHVCHNQSVRGPVHQTPVLLLDGDDEI